MKKILLIFLLVLMPLCYSQDIYPSTLKLFYYEGFFATYNVDIRGNFSDYVLSIYPENQTDETEFIKFYKEGIYYQALTNIEGNMDESNKIQIKLDVPKEYQLQKTLVLNYDVLINNETSHLKFILTYKRDEFSYWMNFIFNSDILKSRERICLDMSVTESMFTENCPTYYYRDVVYLKSWHVLVLGILLIIVFVQVIRKLKKGL